jgi:hypothetical protein
MSANAAIINNSNPVDLVRPNERNEYDVADGIAACCFRVVMVKIIM